MSERSENEAAPGAPAVRCFGCGLEPEEGRVHRLPDGSACTACAARLVEAQPALLPRAGTAQEEVFEEAFAATADELPSAVGRLPGRERFQLLRGEGAVAPGPGVPLLDPGPPEPA